MPSARTRPTAEKGQPPENGPKPGEGLRQRRGTLKRSKENERFLPNGNPGPRKSQLSPDAPRPLASQTHKGSSGGASSGIGHGAGGDAGADGGAARYAYVHEESGVWFEDRVENEKIFYPLHLLYCPQPGCTWTRRVYAVSASVASWGNIPQRVCPNPWVQARNESNSYRKIKMDIAAHGRFAHGNDWVHPMIFSEAEENQNKKKRIASFHEDFALPWNRETGLVEGAVACFKQDMAKRKQISFSRARYNRLPLRFPRISDLSVKPPTPAEYEIATDEDKRVIPRKERVALALGKGKEATKELDEETGEATHNEKVTLATEEDKETNGETREVPAGEAPQIGLSQAPVALPSIKVAVAGGLEVESLQAHVAPANAEMAVAGAPQVGCSQAPVGLPDSVVLGPGNSSVSLPAEHMSSHPERVSVPAAPRPTPLRDPLQGVNGGGGSTPLVPTTLQSDSPQAGFRRWFGGEEFVQSFLHAMGTGENGDMEKAVQILAISFHATVNAIIKVKRLERVPRHLGGSCYQEHGADVELFIRHATCAVQLAQCAILEFYKQESPAPLGRVQFPVLSGIADICIKHRGAHDFLRDQGGAANYLRKLHVARERALEEKDRVLKLEILVRDAREAERVARENLNRLCKTHTETFGNYAPNGSLAGTSFYESSDITLIASSDLDTPFATETHAGRMTSSLAARCRDLGLGLTDSLPPDQLASMDDRIYDVMEEAEFSAKTMAVQRILDEAKHTHRSRSNRVGERSGSSTERGSSSDTTAGPSKGGSSRGVMDSPTTSSSSDRSRGNHTGCSASGNIDSRTKRKRDRSESGVTADGYSRNSRK